MFLNHLENWNLFNFKKRIMEDLEVMVLFSKFDGNYETLTNKNRYRNAADAKEALEKMNGFDLAGRPIRVGLGNDKFTSESTANLLQRFPGQQSQQPSSGGNRSTLSTNHSTFDRAGGGRDDKGAGNVSALDDTDVGGVNFSNYSRDALMRKLARTDDPADSNGRDDKRPMQAPRTENKPAAVNVPQASRCVILRHMFDASA